MHPLPDSWAHLSDGRNAAILLEPCVRMEVVTLASLNGVVHSWLMLYCSTTQEFLSHRTQRKIIKFAVQAGRDLENVTDIMLQSVEGDRCSTPLAFIQMFTRLGKTF